MTIVPNASPGALWDAAESERRKRAGVAASENSAGLKLEVARRVAREIAASKPCLTTNADEVQQQLLARYGYGHGWLGPAAGALFRCDDWTWTGGRVRSTSVKNHARELKVWRYVGNDQGGGDVASLP